MVGMTRFELATPASRTLCSTKLSHIPLSNEMIAQFQKMQSYKMLFGRSIFTGTFCGFCRIGCFSSFFSRSSLGRFFDSSLWLLRLDGNFSWSGKAFLKPFKSSANYCTCIMNKIYNLFVDVCFIENVLNTLTNIGGSIFKLLV